MRGVSVNDPNRKMVFFDIDGTLIDTPTHQIPESAVRAIHRLQEKGHLAFVNSGRTFVSIEQRIKDIGFDGYVCGCGSRIYYQDEMLYFSEIPHEKCMEIVKKLRECRIAAFFEGPDAVYYDGESPVENPEMEQMKAAFQLFGITSRSLSKEMEKKKITFDKFFCLLNEESDLAGLEAYAEGEFYGTPQGKGHMEFVQNGHSKAEGIFFLQRALHIAPENCYAIGDSENDLSMLKAVPNSIAMGVCAPEILPWCSYQTAPVLEDGIEKALQHYGLI